MRTDRRLTLRAVYALSALALAFATLPARANADSAVSLQFVPDEVALEPGLAQRTVLVIVKVAAPNTLQQAQLKLVASPGVTATVQAPPTIPAAGDAVWTIEIAASERAAKESSVLVRVDYQLDGAKPDGRAGTVAAAIKVTYTPRALAESITATLKQGFDTLEPAPPQPKASAVTPGPTATPERRTVAALLLTNAGLEDIALDRITVLAPDFIDVTSTIALPTRIAGRSTTAVPVEVRAHDRIPPGTVPLLLQLQVSRGAGPAEMVLVADKISVGLPGLADITTALQIPSLLLLPGVLIVLTWTLIWNWTNPGGGEFSLSPRSPQFYLVAITLSIVVAAAYAWYLGLPMDLLKRVSVYDIAVIWFGSILVLGPVLYLAGWVLAALVRAMRTARAAAADRRENPQPDDDPTAILDKLAEHNPRLFLDTCLVVKDGRRQLLFKLGFGAAADGMEWVVPRICIDTRGAPDLGEAVDQAIEDQSLEGLREILKSETGKGCVLTWTKGSVVDRPMPLPSGELGSAQGAQSLVEWR